MTTLDSTLTSAQSLLFKQKISISGKTKAKQKQNVN
jgi:hypothetical protein